MLLVAGLILGACAPPPEPAPTVPPPPLATRHVGPPPTIAPTPTVARTPSPAPSPAPAIFRLEDFDPFSAFYATERDGFYVTTRHSRGRYYYRWDDRRWYALDDRVWFRTVDDLLTVFPGRVPAP